MVSNRALKSVAWVGRFAALYCLVSSAGVAQQAKGHKHSRAAAAEADSTAPEDMSDSGAEGIDEVRVENEMKIGVPDSLVERVWAYLKRRYLPRPTFLEENGAVYGAKASEEFFTDVYYDTPDFQFLRHENGLRHRTRAIPDDAKNRKNGRELMQIKLQRVGEDSTDRSEIKFKIRHYDHSRRYDDNWPAVGIVKRSDRPAFIARLGQLGVNPRDLREMVTLKQRRRRVYVYENGTIFLSLTLDQGTARKFGMTRGLTEIELELNEIVYTGATPEKRKNLEHLNDVVRADLIGQFPSLIQNQTPKYNKVMAAFANGSVAFPILLRLSLHPVLVWAAGCTLFIVGFFGAGFWSARRRPRASVIRGEWHGTVPRRLGHIPNW